MRKPLLKVHNLSLKAKKNGENIYPVQRLSFEVFPSETVGIVGESGSGKTLAMQSILRLLNDEISVKGDVFFQGEDLFRVKDKKLRSIYGKEMSMIFQDPKSSLNPTMKIKKQLTEGLIYHGICNKSEAHKKALELLNMVCLPNPERLLNLYPHQLSGGMRQRITIAIAIACSPKLLIADEPTTALDVSIQLEILNLLKNIQKKHHMSIIFISHDLSAVHMICDRILVMYGGLIIEQGTTSEVLSCPKHPYTKLLLESIPTVDKNKNNNPLRTIPGVFSPKKILDELCPFYTRCPSAMKICTKIPPPLINNTLCWLHDKTNISPTNKKFSKELSESSSCCK